MVSFSVKSINHSKDCFIFTDIHKPHLNIVCGFITVETCCSLSFSNALLDARRVKVVCLDGIAYFPWQFVKSL